MTQSLFCLEELFAAMGGNVDCDDIGIWWVDGCYFLEMDGLDSSIG